MDPGIHLKFIAFLFLLADGSPRWLISAGNATAFFWRDGALRRYLFSAKGAAHQ